jgi:hypothetical protein
MLMGVCVMAAVVMAVIITVTIGQIIMSMIMSVIVLVIVIVLVLVLMPMLMRMIMSHLELIMIMNVVVSVYRYLCLEVLLRCALPDLRTGFGTVEAIG